jgi:hypothetical protein
VAARACASPQLGHGVGLAGRSSATLVIRLTSSVGSGRHLVKVPGVQTVQRG